MTARAAVPSLRRGLAVVGMVAMMAGVLAVFAGPASAHPLGNFSVNHHHDLVLSPSGLDLRSVVDMAEVPTRQEQPAIDADGDGQLSAPERDATAQEWCADFAAAVTTTVEGDEVTWALEDADLVTLPGAAGLVTLRLTCDMRADADLSSAATVAFADGYRGERVGWHEIVARGDGVTLVDPPVPATSISDELRAYPEDLLASPVDVRRAVLEVRPGGGTDDTAGVGEALAAGGDPFTRLVAAGDALLASTIGRDRLTPLVGGLALLLAALLGAGHALLPGHGKTVMAAYLAGRRGTRVDALIVGGTVTITHTAGVLLLGLLLTVGSAIAGEVILQRLGLVSGALIAAIGAGLLRDAIRSRRAQRERRSAAAAPGDAEMGTGSSEVGPAASLVAVGAGSGDGVHATHVHAAEPGGPLDHAHTHSHDHAHAHDPADSHEHGHGHGHAHGHAHGHHHGPADGDPRFSRRGLVGMAVAGGLVPSPSALVVLLGSIALGRTLFGMTLVLAYGVGMAATLTAVGLLLVKLRSRLDHLHGTGWKRDLAARLNGVLPIGTAALVLVVGLGLVARALATST